MPQWLLYLFGRSRTNSRAEADDPDAPADDTHDPPAWAAEMIGSLQKASRGQARVAARIEELEGKVEAGFADLRASIGILTSASHAQSDSSARRWDALLDSIDLLVEAAARVDREACPGLGEGLDAIASRLGGFLEQESMVRVGARGMAADGKVFRVVGTEDQPDLPDGVIARVVRAAVLRGDRVVREGHVITNRRTS